MEFFEVKTKNGIPVYFMQISGLKSVACGALINVGSRDEDVNQFGIAHALEHMPFKGTKKFNDSLSLSGYIEEVGGRINATTNKDRTFFYSKVPDYEVERAIDWLHQVLEEPLLKESDWESEKKVIIEEIKRNNDNPASFFSNLVISNLFSTHPIGHPVLGTEQAISNLSISDLITFRKKFYNPSNYAFFVAGNIDNQKILGLLNHYFGEIEFGQKNSNRAGVLKMPDKKIFIGSKDFNQMKFNLSFFIDQVSFDERLALDFFVSMINVGGASPLFQELRIKRNLIYSVNTAYYPGLDVGYFSIVMNTSSQNYEEINKLVLSIIDQTKEDKNRFEKTKSMMLGELSFYFESPLNIISSAAKEMVYFGKPIGYKEYKEKIENLNFEKIKKVVEKYLNQQNSYLNILLLKQK